MLAGNFDFKKLPRESFLVSCGCPPGASDAQTHLPHSERGSISRAVVACEEIYA